MSLQVWLPLNGTTKNCGISDATASLINNPQVVASNRGECYNFNPNNENNQAIEVTFSNMPNLIKKEFSIAFWIYHRDNSDRSIIFGNHEYNGNYTFNIEKTIDNQLKIYMQAKPDVSFSTCAIDVNTWTHITIVKNMTELYVYKNGVKVATRSHISSDLWQYADGIKYLLGRDARTDNTALNGMLSDFRIYDHILSQKEINSLAQGLMLNYSFNDVYMSATTNLVNMADGTFVKNASSAWHAGLQCASTYVTPGKTYTFSCDIRHSGTKAYSVYFDTNCTDDGGVYSGNDAAMQDIKSNTGIIIPNNGTWVRAWVTVTIKPDAGHPYIHHTLCPSVSAEEVTFYYRNVQLEEGPTATPYTPYGNPREGVVNDVSGWGRHGKLRTSKCYVSSDTILGNCSLLLDGSDNIDRAHVFTDLNLNDIKNYTFASFIKVNKWGIQDSGLISADFNNSLHPVDYYRSPIHHRDGGFDISVIGNNSDSISATHQILNCSSSDFPIGKWTHIAVTFNGTVATLYINGVSKRNISFGNPVTLYACKYLFLSYSCAGGAHRVTNSNWADFRIYSTCLSAEDIKKLATAKTAIDKSNNLHCYSLAENENIESNVDVKHNFNVGIKQQINIYPGVQHNASAMNVIYNMPTEVFKEYGFNTCTKFVTTNTSSAAVYAYSYLLPTSYYTPGGIYSFSCYAYVPSECNANLRIHLEQGASWVKNYQNTTSNINDSTKDKVIKVTGTIKANNKGQIFIMFYPNPYLTNTFTSGYFLIAGLTIVEGEDIPHPRIEKTSDNLIKSITPRDNMSSNGTYSLIGDFSKNLDTYSYFNTDGLELNKMYRLTFSVSNLSSGSIWDWQLWNSSNYSIRIDQNGLYHYTFIVDANKLPSDYNLTSFLWDDGARINPSGNVYFNDFKLVECYAQPWHGIFETNKTAIHSLYTETNSIYED